MRHIFLSPHFDDAIGSCGGTIARLVRDGADVIVCTLFGGEGQAPFSDFAASLHRQWRLGENAVAERRREDAEAATTIGCRAEWLQYLEAIYRTGADGKPLYARGADLFAGVNAADSDLAGRIGETLRGRLDLADRIYGPAAFGDHADHQIAFAAGQALRSAGLHVQFYREFFYAEKADSATRLSGLDLVDAPFGPVEFALKCAAVVCYRSQIRWLFGSEGAMHLHFENTNRRDSEMGYAEIFWRDPAST